MWCAREGCSKGPFAGTGDGRDDRDDACESEHDGRELADGGGGRCSEGGGTGEVREEEDAFTRVAVRERADEGTREGGRQHADEADDADPRSAAVAIGVDADGDGVGPLAGDEGGGGELEVAEVGVAEDLGDGARGEGERAGGGHIRCDLCHHDPPGPSYDSLGRGGARG